MIRGLILAALSACLAALSSGIAYASARHFDVTISTALTHNMALNNGVYSPTGDNAVLNVNDLTNALNAGSLKVTTGAQRGDIDIEAAFHWVSASALTLDAFRSIRDKQPVTDAGTGALTLTTNDGGANGHLEYSAGGNVSFWSLANTLTINGKTYTLVNSVASLAAAVTANPAGNYALASSYDASVDHKYKQDPIEPTFLGNFEGLGNTISNVSIRFAPQNGSNVGFFNTIAAGASVSNLHLSNLAIHVPLVGVAGVGGLAGDSEGALYGDEVSGAVIAQKSLYLGGLIGTGSGSIVRCSAAVIVGSLLGGVSGEGGLAGGFAGTISDTFASGNVRGGESSEAIGGLVGLSNAVTAIISHSHATGNIFAPFTSGVAGVGGLVGFADAPVIDSYATGNVKDEGAAAPAGGLVGTEWKSSITRSFATGNVDVRREANAGGGLVGATWSSPFSIANSYAIGAMRGGSNDSVGGLVGGSGPKDSISNSYAVGDLTNSFEGGGFACGLSQFSNDYWNTTTSGTTYGICGNTNASGVTGLTTTQLQSGLPAGFDPKIWAQDRKINKGFPYLISNPPPR